VTSRPPAARESAGPGTRHAATRLRALWAVMRLDLAELVRSRWLVMSLVVYGVLCAVFILVGLHESELLGFTGAGRVLVSLTHALLVLLPLLALTGTSQAINRARDDGTLEVLLSHPIPRGAWFLGVAATRYLALLLPLVVAMGAVAAWARLVHGQAIPWGFLGRCLAVSASLLAAFSGLGLLVSVLVRHAGRAALNALLIWVASIALLDLALAGLMLQWRLPARAVFVLAAANPVQAARMALLSSADPELSVLGPVGFYLVHRIGPDALHALGVAWPAALGVAAAALAWLSFRRGDLV